VRCRYLADFLPGPFSQIFAHVIHEPDEEGDGGEKEEEGGERQVARPHHVQRFPVRAQRESVFVPLTLKGLSHTSWIGL
jgi:hypothetical protein